ncbi:MAG: DUF58 domain-containing protein [Myxococcota bacterium]
MSASGNPARARHGWRRRLRSVVDLFPLTRLGVFVVAAATLALVHFGLRKLDLVLLVVGGAFLVLAVLGFLAVLLTSLLLARHLRRRTPTTDTIDVECGFPHRTGFSIGAVRFIPFVDVTWAWAKPEAHSRVVVERGRLVEEVTGLRRGIVSGVVRRFVVRDAFGLSEIAWEGSDNQPLRFTPSVGALQNIEVIRGMSAGEDLPHPEAPAEGGPFDMRHYTPGDPIRFVLWKVFAKSRELIVRTPERALAPARQTAAYLVTGQSDEPAAGAARLAVAAGTLGTGWTLGADGCANPASTAGVALDLLTRSAGTPDDRGGADLASFIKEQSEGSASRMVIFVPGRPGPWLSRVVDAIRTYGPRIELVVCVDGISAKRRKGLAAVLRQSGGGEAPGVPLDDIQAVMHALAGVKITVVDRRSGQIFTAEHMRAMEVAA